MFIEKLPDVMLIHLKRFEYDVATYNIAKVKQKFKFPMSLNMFRYTRAGVAAAIEEDGKEEHDDKNLDTMKSENELSSKVEQLGGESKVRAAELSEDSKAISSDPAFDYELVGVIVHNGASEQSGHYYSYALVPPDKDRTSSSHQHGIETDNSEKFSMNGKGKWFKFNDKSVTPFDPSTGAESEWFGGKSHVPVINQYTGEPIGNSTRLEFRNNSAYMLVYRRKNNPISPDSASESNSEITRAALNMFQGHSLTTGQKMQTSNEQFSLLSQIWHENDLAIRTRWLFDPEFFSFMRDILVMAASSTDGNQDDAQKMTSIIKVAVEFFVNVVIKGKDKSDLKRWVEVIASLLISAPAAAAHILESASSRTYVQEKIIRQSLPELREVFSDLCLSAIKALVPVNDSISDVVESKEAKSVSNKGGERCDKLSPEGQMLLDIMIADPEDTPTSIVNGVSCEDIISKCQPAESSKDSEATGAVTTEIQKGLEKTHHTAGESTSHYVLLVARFVRILFQEVHDHINLVNESNWRRFGEFFRLLRGCAKLGTVRAYMVRIGFQNALLGFYAGTLPGMQSWSLTIKNPQYGTADFDDLLGAVANLCCAPDALRFLNMPMLLTGEHILQARSDKGGNIHSKPEDTVIGKLFLQHKNYHTVQCMIGAYSGGSRAFFTAVHRRLIEKLSEGVYSAEILRALESGVIKLAISQEDNLVRFIERGMPQDLVEKETKRVNSALDQLLFSVQFGIITCIQSKLAIVQSSSVGVSPTTVYNLIQILKFALMRKKMQVKTLKPVKMNGTAYF
eukprot:g4963.t1